MIPNVDAAVIRDALNRFDMVERASERWRAWEQRPNFKFAIEHDGRKYPVKRIVALATGVPESQFSGGEEANTYVRARGFEVVILREQETPNSLSSLLRRVCELQLTYSSANTPEMQERGEHVRRNAPEVLRSWLPDGAALDVKGKDGTGRKTRVPWFRVFSPAQSPSPTQGFYLVYLFAADGSSIALSLNQGTTTFDDGAFLPKPAHEIAANVERARAALSSAANTKPLQDEISLADPGGLGEGYEKGNIFAINYAAQSIPSDETLRADFLRMVSLLERLYEVEAEASAKDQDDNENREADSVRVAIGSLTQHVIESLEAYGFAYEPWQVATFVAAIRTKPFVILAGISGTGKTKLPILAALATGSERTVIPVRPDWHDSGDLLGYTDLSDRFRPKPFLDECLKANQNPDYQHFVVIDEMNIARVEHYFAEVLSRMEDRIFAGGTSAPLVQSGGAGHESYKEVGIPPNLAIVGTVNMDESTHGFSKKVLDRAFTIELSDIDLTQIPSILGTPTPVEFGGAGWRGEFLRLAEAADAGNNEQIIKTGIAQLQQLNHVLGRAQVQLGYRSRDEILLFVLNAQIDEPYFADSKGNRVDPFDLALMMKVLPRIAGSSHAVERVLDGILELCVPGKTAAATLASWLEADMPAAVLNAIWPRTAARTCLMKQRLEDGYTSFFL